MSAYSENIYKALQLIPRGKVTTYKLLAKKVGIKSPRVVGNLLHKNTDGNQYPCHRVVRSDGRIASGYAMGGPSEQYKKLKEEGVTFLANGKVDLNISVFAFSNK